MVDSRVNQYGVHFHVGDTVRLRDQAATARIVGFYVTVPGGVFLDRKLCGLRSWNVDDLERVPKTERRSEP